MLKMKQLCVMMACATQGFTYVYANEIAEKEHPAANIDTTEVQTLEAINVVVSADASANGLMKPYAGGGKSRQVVKWAFSVIRKI